MSKGIHKTKLSNYYSNKYFLTSIATYHKQLTPICMAKLDRHIHHKVASTSPSRSLALRSQRIKLHTAQLIEPKLGDFESKPRSSWASLFFYPHVGPIGRLIE